jgi:hypothetical protein
MIVAFICDTDRVEQGRFMENAQNVMSDGIESLSVTLSPRTNADAVLEERLSHSETSEFRLLSKQTKKDGRSYELRIILALLVSIFYLLRFRYNESYACIQSCEAAIINYIQRQDGKK